MSKRRKVLVILGVIAVAAVCIATFWPPDEPKYQGRYLSEWMARYERHDQDQTSPEFVEVQKAVQTIGTNALPYFLKWIRYDLPPWRVSLYNKIPLKLRADSRVADWLAGDHSIAGINGFYILGTNAVSAIPELKAIVSDPAKPYAASCAIIALGFIGEPAIPALQSAFADPNQPHRSTIVGAFASMVRAGHKNACLPIILEAINDKDPSVSLTARDLVKAIAPRFLTNAPAP